MPKKKKLKVQNNEIVFFTQKDEDYISLTDIARYKNSEEPKDVIKNWLRNRNTIEFIGLWEKINNPDFKGVEFDSFRMQSGLNSFVLSPQRWIESTNAKGIISKSGRGGGTYAHKDIAFEFASWISAEIKLYIIKEFQRLKTGENEKKELGWNEKRILTKVNYKIHTDAIKEHLIPERITAKQLKNVYSSEADLLNMALFGMTAKEWRIKNPSKDGNIRDYTDVRQLVCLANLESLNAEFIREGLSQMERLQRLNRIAIIQMKSLAESQTVERLNVTE